MMTGAQARIDDCDQQDHRGQGHEHDGEATQGGVARRGPVHRADEAGLQDRADARLNTLS
jgi:hypothetical protein